MVCSAVSIEWLRAFITLLCSDVWIMMFCDNVDSEMCLYEVPRSLFLLGYRIGMMPISTCIRIYIYLFSYTQTMKI